MRKVWVLFFVAGLCGCTRVNEASKNVEDTKQPAMAQEEEAVQHTLDCTKESDSVSFQAQGDHVESQIQTFYLSFADLGIGEGMSSEDMMNAINSSLARSYDALQGVDAVGSLEDNRVKVTVTIDYRRADIQALIDAGLLHEGEVDTKYVSLGKTQTQLEKEGYSCTVQ